MKKFSSLLVVLLLMSVSFSAHAQGYPRGDVDRDGSVNISDVTCLIDNLLNGISEGDVDQDGAVNISDATCLIDYLLSGSWTDDPMPPTHEGDWVDLGLPSGTLWATCNIGAEAPEGYGDYFAWGETEPKYDYTLSNYKWCNGSENSMTKYCSDSEYGYNGFTDGKTELDLEDDAAYVNWGPSWRMPTYEQHCELAEQCTWTCITRNGVNGQLGTGPNGNTIFLPYAGAIWYGSKTGEGRWCKYWSRTRCPDPDPYWSNTRACVLFIHTSVDLDWYIYRDVGSPVRAVRVVQN